MRRLAALALLCAAAPLAAATFTVTNTGDSGAGSLRQAILDANANGGADLIHFAIPGSDPGCDGSGVCTIAPTSGLHSIDEAVTIDGYTQSGAVTNSATNGTNAVLKVVLSGANVPGADGLAVGAGPTTIRGLVINGGFNAAIDILTQDAAHVEGCFLGTDASGMTASTVSNGVLFFLKGFGSVIGGAALSQRNLIGSSAEAVSGGVGDLLLQNNLIGTDATGAALLPQLPGGSGIDIGLCLSGNTATIVDNVIGTGFARSGILTQCLPATIQGNHVGVDATGTVAFPPHMQYGIEPSQGSAVGGPDPGQGNVVTGMRWAGIIPAVVSGPIRGNSIYGNGGDPLGSGLGIDVNNDGITRNDPGDADGIQNFPLLKSVTTGATTHVVAVLHSAASTGYDIDFFSNPACTNFPHEFDEGQVYLGSAHVTTDGSGDADIDAVLPVATEAGARITMTATNTVTGHTSEFSQRLPFSVTPAGGPAAGGTAFTVSGTDFAAGAALTIGGAAASSVVVSNDHTITASSPALPAGSVNDLVVTNTDGTSGTLVKGWVSDFLDVNGGNQFYSFVTTLVSNAITVGVGGGNYGVDQPTLRQQMAVFLLKARHGLCYAPPPCSGVFPDVPCPSTFANWIEALAAEGITGGCGSGNYCPTSPVRRDQMAVFLLKAEHGSGYAPPACAGVFTDVPCPSAFANWIEQLAAEQITGGCGGGNYCPTSSNTRGQMAVFITKAFHLQ